MVEDESEDRLVAKAEVEVEEECEDRIVVEVAVAVDKVVVDEDEHGDEDVKKE